MYGANVITLLMLFVQTRSNYLASSRTGDAHASVVDRASTSKLESVNQVHGSMDKLVHKISDKLFEKLFDQARKAPARHFAPMDSTTLGKPSHFAHGIPLCTSLQAHSPFGALLHVIPGGFRSSQASHWSPFHRRGALARRMHASVHGINHHDLIDLASATIKVNDAKAALSILRDLPKNWLDWYDGNALHFPVATKAMTSGFCFTVGDLAAQGMAGKNITNVDLGRSARSGAAGLIYHGPMAHYWLNFLDKSFSFGGAWWCCLPKIALDQGPMAIIDNTFYSLLTGAMAFKDPREVLLHVWATLKPGFMANLRFWPLVHLITFTVVPIELQVLWEDSMDIVWICILSTLTNQLQETLTEREAEHGKTKVQIASPEEEMVELLASTHIPDSHKRGGVTWRGYGKKVDEDGR